MTLPKRLVLPRERPGQPANPELLQRRELLAKALAACTPSEMTCVRGVRAVHFGSAEQADTVMVHFHGGGFRQGQPEMLAGYATRVAEAAQMRVMCPAYRLSPEHPFPAGLVDATEFVADVATQGYRRIILAGDSAGGGIAAATALLCLDRGIPIGALILHSPWLDLTVSSHFYDANAGSDPLFSRAAAREASSLYLQGHSSLDPLASPIFGDLTEYPPTFLSVGRGEVLLGDAATFYARLQAAGRPAHMCEVDGMDHVAVTRGHAHAGSERVYREMLEFISRLP